MYLNCHTYYSLRYGTFSEKELLEMASKKEIQQLTLTDINNTSACLNTIRLSKKYGIKVNVGIDFRNGNQQLYVGIAKNNEGFLELNHFLSQHLHEKTFLPSTAPKVENAYIIYPFQACVKQKKDSFLDHEFIGVSLKDLRQIRFSELYRQKEKMVLLQTVTFRNKKDFNAHRLLRAIDNNTLLSKLSLSEQADPDEVMHHPKTLKLWLKDFPFLIQNTEKIMESCCVSFDFSSERKPQNLKTYTGSIQGDQEKIRQLCEEGLSYRYKNVTPTIQSRIEKELKLIQQMNFVSFFLINWDIISYAKRQGYYHVGRGSGANSIVAYLLGITDVDPIDLDLYFERFINLYRANPPDFDIDFSSKDREDITRYIFSQFGKNGQAALLATYNTFKHSAAVREIGKVFGLPKHEIDVLSSNKFNFNRLDKLSQLVVKYADHIQGIPNHLSIHAGGILIAQKPIHYFSATNLPPKGFPTTQFDMVIAEDVGLYKFDILGQRGLGKIKDALAIVKKNHPNAPTVDIHDVKPFITDKKINRLVAQAKCIGCFYVESPAMRMLLKKLEVNNYLGLVAASSIIRPGVAKSGMMREYILRHKNPERRADAHPVMWGLMEDTYGIMVYQEDVIKVAHHFADLDLGEADVLRRGMSGKFRSREEFQRVKRKFIENCRKKGEPDDVIFDVWRQIESFAGYAFAKGHSASYAVESYQSLYLKTYYPLEYMVAVLNNGGGFYRTELYIHEARMLGATIHAPCLNKSEYKTTIYGSDIYLGFQHLSGLDGYIGLSIENERALHGNYQSLNDFMHRIKIGIEQLSILIRAGAFRFSRIDKRTLLWKAHFQLNHTPSANHQKQLFHMESKSFDLPDFHISELEDAFDEMELLGFSLCSPFKLLQKKITSPLLAKDLKKHISQTITLYGYLISIKNTSTASGKRMNFGTFLDLSGQWIDSVHFPPVAAAYPFRGKGVYRLTGKVVEEFDFLTLEISNMEKAAFISDPRYEECMTA